MIFGELMKGSFFSCTLIYNLWISFPYAFSVFLILHSLLCSDNFFRWYICSLWVAIICKVMKAFILYFNTVIRFISSYLFQFTVFRRSCLMILLCATYITLKIHLQITSFSPFTCFPTSQWANRFFQRWYLSRLPNLRNPIFGKVIGTSSIIFKLLRIWDDGIIS